ncbi:MAG: DUF362 domain-containing protein [Proteobacteria bacterium]|nr:DUF362 domain-containing protein [Pseudomonadota bacterium]
MIPAITLKKGRLSHVLRKNLHNYYNGAGIDSNYATMKWHRRKDNSGIVIFIAKKDNTVVGWIIYNPRKSTVEEILIKKEWREKDIEHEMADALVAKENLVSAEIHKDDKEKYQWMIEYGFRPTRSFMAEGFPVVRMDLSTSVLLQKLHGMKPAKAYRKMEKVTIEKIPETQAYEEIKEGVKHLIDTLGGLKKFVKTGQTVVIKPNIVSDHGLKDGAYKGGIVTDIRVIRALVELLLPVAGKIIIGEGSSINRSETAKMFQHYGYDSLVDLDPVKVSLVDLNTDKQVEKPVPGGKRMLSRKIPLTIEEADVIISVPVLKIHFAAVASLSIKHLQGAIPPLEKYMTHFFGLWQNLVNIHHLIKPKLIIIDGLTGQEDFGPISGTPKKMDLLIGGTNPVAIDAVAMRVMGIDPATSPPVFLAYMQGMGPIESDKINIIGPSINEVTSPFKQPEINVKSGRDITIHVGSACSGCTGYLHFVLNKLRKSDPKDESRMLIDRPFDRKVNIFPGPVNQYPINPDETNIFMGICQQHNAEMGTHLPGCPPHAEAIVNGIFGLFPDIERPQYADKSEEAKLGEMLQEILAMT